MSSTTTNTDCAEQYTKQCYLATPSPYPTWMSEGGIRHITFHHTVFYFCGARVDVVSDSQRALAKAILDAVTRPCPACETGEPVVRKVETIGGDVWLTKQKQER